MPPRSAALLLLLAGCTGPAPEAAEAVAALAGGVVPAAFPLRADWLVVNPPAVAPSGPGPADAYPIDALDRGPAALAGDLAALGQSAQANQILDPKTLPPATRAELARLLEAAFGPPAAPRVAALPREQEAALGLDPQTLAAGARVYARHCALCHGPNGDGRGPAGAAYNPHPRDYRQGRFKFVSTALSAGEARPRRDDLMRTLVQGIPASGMPSFAMLGDRQLREVVSYVIYLGLRGECEYGLLRGMLSDQVDPEDPAAWKQELGERLKAVAGFWVLSQQSPVVPDPDPYATAGDRLKAAVEGQKHFTALCTKCHINYGRAPFYTWDDWGTVARPRNLVAAQYRGGRRGVDLYYRVYCGVAGSNMPGFAKELRPTPTEKAAGEDKLWQVVHFVDHLGTAAGRAKLRAAGVDLE